MSLKFSPEGWRDSDTGEIVETFDPDAPPVLPQKPAKPFSYISPASGKEITTNGQRAEDMKATDSVDANDFPTKREEPGKLQSDTFARKWGLEHKLR